MTSDEWQNKHVALASILHDEGLSPIRALNASRDITTEIHGPPPARRRQWENDALDVAVELSDDATTVDVSVDGEWVFLAPADARLMAEALVKVADQAETTVTA